MTDEYGLAEFDDVFMQAPKERPKKPRVPDGTYQVIVDCVELMCSKNKGTPGLKWDLKVLEGKHKNEFIWKTNWITEKTIAFLKQDLFTAGFNVDDFKPSMLNAQTIKPLLDVCLEVYVSSEAEGEYTNVDVRFNKRIEVEGYGKEPEDLLFPSEETPPKPDPPKGDDDEYPF